jgi:hypothetical protein
MASFSSELDDTIASAWADITDVVRTGFQFLNFNIVAFSVSAFLAKQNFTFSHRRIQPHGV